MAWLYKQTGSENWWLGYRHNGRQYLRSTKTDDRAAAERELAKVRMLFEAQRAGSLTEELYRTLANKAKSNVTFAALRDQWLSEVADEGTRERYKNAMDSLTKFLHADANKPLIENITKEELRDFIRRESRQLAHGTTKLTRRVLNAFFEYAVENEVLRDNPTPSLKSVKLDGAIKNDTERRSFTLEEVQDLLTIATDDFWRYMLLGGFYLGQRMGTLICMPWGAVDFKTGTMSFQTSKHSKRVKSIRIYPALLAVMQKRRAEATHKKPSDHIWPEQAEKYIKHGAGNFSNKFYENFLLPCGLVAKRTHHKKKDSTTKRRKAGNEVSFHCLRHTFISMIKISGGSQAVAKELVGHSSDAVSDLYTHIPEETLGAAILQLPDVTATIKEAK